MGTISPATGEERMRARAKRKFEVGDEFVCTNRYFMATYRITNVRKYDYEIARTVYSLSDVSRPEEMITFNQKDFKELVDDGIFKPSEGQFL